MELTLFLGYKYKMTFKRGNLRIVSFIRTGCLYTSQHTLTVEKCPTLSYKNLLKQYYSSAPTKILRFLIGQTVKNWLWTRPRSTNVSKLRINLTDKIWGEVVLSKPVCGDNFSLNWKTINSTKRVTVLFPNYFPTKSFA